MKTIWQIQEAKNKLSEVLDMAIKDGPQEITKRGKKTAVVLSIDEYNRLNHKKGSLAEFFAKSPLREIDLDRR